MTGKSLAVAFLALSLGTAAMAQSEAPTEQPPMVESPSAHEPAAPDELQAQPPQNDDAVLETGEPLPTEAIGSVVSNEAVTQSDQELSAEELREGEQLMWAFLLAPLVLIALVATACVAIANHAWQKYQYRVFWNGLNFLVAAGLLTAWMFVGLYGWGSYLVVVPAVFLLIPLWNAIRRTGWKTGVLVWIAQIVGLPLVIFAAMMARGAMNARHA